MKSSSKVDTSRLRREIRRLLQEQYRPAHGDEPVTGDPARVLSGDDLEKFQKRSVSNAERELAGMSHPRRPSYAQRAADADEQRKADVAHDESMRLYHQSKEASEKYEKNAQHEYDEAKKKEADASTKKTEEIKKKIITTLDAAKDDHKSSIPYFKLSELWNDISLPGTNKKIGSVLDELVASKALPSGEFEKIKKMKWDEAVAALKGIFGINESANSRDIIRSEKVSTVQEASLNNDNAILAERWQRLAGIIK